MNLNPEQILILKILYVEKTINNKPITLTELQEIMNNKESVRAYEEKFKQLKNDNK